MINEIREIAALLAPTGQAVQQTALAYVAADIVSTIVPALTIIAALLIIPREIRKSRMYDTQKELQEKYRKGYEREVANLPSFKLVDTGTLVTRHEELKRAVRKFSDNNTQNGYLDTRIYLSKESEERLINFLNNN